MGQGITQGGSRGRAILPGAYRKKKKKKKKWESWGRLIQEAAEIIKVVLGIRRLTDNFGPVKSR